MLKYCLDKWNQNKFLLENRIRKDRTLNSCDYLYLVKLVVDFILNPDADEYEMWDSKRITKVDDGEYQGTVLFLIPAKVYQPGEYEYLMTYVGYGSCSGCDTLQAIQGWDDESPLTEKQVGDFMVLCKDILTNIIKPYNYGWRYTEDFDEVIDNQTIANKVPMVRCRDCIHRGSPNCPMYFEDEGWREHYGGGFPAADRTEDDGFCHLGKYSEEWK